MLAIRQVEGLCKKQLCLQFRQKKTLCCQCCFPITILVACFLFALATSRVINLDSLLPQPGIQEFQKFDVSKIIEDATKLQTYYPQYILTTGYNKDEIGVASRYGDSTGFLQNLYQVNKTTGKFPFSDNSFTNLTETDLYIGYLVNKQRTSFGGRVSEILNLLGAVDFKEFSSKKFDYTITYDKAACNGCPTICTMTVYGSDGRPAIPVECENAIRTTLISKLNSAYLSKLVSKPIKIETTVQKMPFLFYTFNIIDQLKSLLKSGLISFDIILLFPLPVFISSILIEKGRIREMMKTNGLKMYMYWIVNLVWNYSFYTISVLSAVILAAIFQFKFIIYGNVIVNFLFFSLWGFALLGYSLLISSLFSNYMLAMSFTYLIALFEPAIGFYIARTLPLEWRYIATYLIMPLPLHVTLDIGIIVPCEKFMCPGIYQLFEFNSLTVGLFFMFINGIIYGLLGLYLDEVLPSQFGVSQNIFFCLKPIYKPIMKLFNKKKKENSIESEPLITNSINQSNDEEDTDVYQERMNIEESKKDSMIVIQNLVKYYGSKLAVNDLSFSIKNNTIFSLLGHNGAGKTTTLSILSGLYAPSSGTAFVNGKDIRENLDIVRLSLGFCPQHDVLWDELTISEHLHFYARLKGVSRSQEAQLVQNAIKLVGLDGIDKLSSELSGGMKRRLSIAISIVGDPSVVLLDEPTTGLDPTSKRQIWDILTNIKQSKCMILTTHSLEEADVLSDRIGIMSQGKLMCIGTAQHLKTKFGDGYRLTVSYDESNVLPVHNYIREVVPNAKVLSQFEGSTVFVVPKQNIQVSELFKEIENHKDEKKIKNWGFSQTSLEDVFLKIAQNDEGNI